MRFWLLALILWTSLAACRGADRSARPNVLFLVIDALRADHLGSFGYGRPTSPAMDRLASRATLFLKAHSASHFTRGSVPSIFTGCYASAHGVLEKTDSLNDGFDTMAEIFSRNGYKTAAWMPNPNLRRGFNFNQGFDLYDDEVLVEDTTLPLHERFETATRIQSRAIAYLERTDQRPFFLYLHYRDVHGPYIAPPPYDRLFVDSSATVAPGEGRLLSDRERAPPSIRRRDDGGRLDFYLALYDAAIRYTDDRLAEFLSDLERRGLLANTYVVLTADHGEAFLEHGQWEHGKTLFEEEMHVPLLILSPTGRGAGLRVEREVSGVDILPTLIDLLGLEGRPSVMQGRSLVPAIDGRELEPVPIFGVGARGQFAIWSESKKLIYRGQNEGWSLYDLASDPAEKIDLLALDAPAATRLRDQLRAFRRSSLAIAQRLPVGHQGITARTVAQLRALGYL